MSSSVAFLSSQYMEDRVTSQDAENRPNIGFHSDLVSFLSVVQRFNIDIMPVTWNALNALGYGATADIYQSVINIAMSFAFKRTTRLFDERGEIKAFQVLILEVFLLGNPSIRDHPNIVDLEGICWETNDNNDLRPVLVFQRAQHGDLMRFLSSEKGCESLFNTRLKLCVDIAKAIMAMHSCNIIHGDIKPQNILVFKDSDGSLTAKVTDFGYSCFGLAEDDVVQLPRSQPWNAPECELKYEFKLRDAKKTDIYSLGMVFLYSLFEKQLAGDAQSCTNLATGRSEDLLGQWNPERRLHKVHEMLEQTVDLSDTQRASLWGFFQSTLSVDPDARKTDLKALIKYPETPTAVVPRIEVLDSNVLEHANFRVAESVLDLRYFDYLVRQKITASIEARAWGSQNSSTQSCTACQLKAAFQLAFCFKLGFGVPANEKQASRWLELSGGNMDELQEEIVLVQNKTRPRSNRMTQQNLNTLELEVQYLKRASLEDIESSYRTEISDMEASLGSTHPVTKALRYILVLTFIGYGNFEKAEQDTRHSLEIEEKILGSDHPSTLASMANLAETYKAQGRGNEAEVLEVQVMETRKRVLGQEDLHTLVSMNNLASTLRNQGRWKEAEVLLVQVVETRKKVLGQDHPFTLTSVGNLASIYSEQGQWKEAEELEVQVMEARREVLGQEHPATLISMGNLASTYKAQGLLKKAEELEVQVMETFKRVLGPEHPHTLISMNNLASTLRHQGRKEAEGLEVQVMETFKRVLGEDHPSTLSSMANVASTYTDPGRWKEAEGLFVQVTEARKRVLGPDHPDTLTSMANLASIFWNQGRLMEAEVLEVQVMEAFERVLGQEHPETLTSMANLAHTIKLQGRVDEAIAMMEQAAALRSHKLGEDHPDTKGSMKTLAKWRDEVQSTSK